MRYMLTGVDAEGRSCVVEETELGRPGDEMVQHRVFATDQSPPGPRPTGHGADLDLGVAPGLARWLGVHWPAGREAHLHHTDTVDFDTVLGGSVVLVLDDGDHLMEVGDCVLVDGVDHSWRAGPEGCTMSVVLLGSVPPS